MISTSGETAMMKLEMKKEIPAKVEALDEKAVRVAKQFASCEKELVSIFEELGKTKGFLYFDCNSLFEYGVKRLKLSEASVYNINAVAKKTCEFPELKQAIMAGELTVSKARKITPVLTHENKAEWIKLAKASTSREIEKAVATEKPELLIKETILYKAADRLEFKCGVTEKLYEKLKRAKDLESQRTSKAVSFEEMLDAIIEVYFEKVDPVRKAERAEKRADKKPEKINANAPVPGQVLGGAASKSSTKKLTLKFTREAVPAVMKHAVTLRDLRRCTHLYSDGTRCECTRWLDVHHIIPISEGGKNEISNLTTMCRTHHQMLHQD